MHGRGRCRRPPYPLCEPVCPCSHTLSPGCTGWPPGCAQPAWHAGGAEGGGLVHLWQPGPPPLAGPAFPHPGILERALSGTVSARPRGDQRHCQLWASAPSRAPLPARAEAPVVGGRVSCPEVPSPVAVCVWVSGPVYPRRGAPSPVGPPGWRLGTPHLLAGAHPLAGPVERAAGANVARPGARVSPPLPSPAALYVLPGLRVRGSCYAPGRSPLRVRGRPPSVPLPARARLRAAGRGWEPGMPLWAGAVCQHARGMASSPSAGGGSREA